MTRHIIIILALLLTLPGVGWSKQAQDAETLFHQFSDRLYQIKLIEKKSGATYSSGSGFQITAQGHIATNYHVVASLIHKPDTYQMECIDENGLHHPLSLIDIDIINDLAIVQCDDIPENYLHYKMDQPSRGAKIYAIGNPYDLSMAIVEGNYNGLLQDRLYERILFSGALNPGMSGGPSIDGEGRVVGINVSTKGNEIGFLVPVRFLQALMTRQEAAPGPPDDYHQLIEQQLLENQKRFMAEVMSADWEIEPYAEALIPKIQKDYIKGWGEKFADEKKMYRHTYSGYAIRSGVFVSRGVLTGRLRVQYDWFETDQLNSLQFYHKVQKTFNSYTKPNNASGKDRSNYHKKTSFLHHAGMDWKLSFAVRNYRKYPQLYDYTLNMVSLNKPDRAIVVSAALAGVSKENGNAFVKKFIENIQWQN